MTISYFLNCIGKTALLYNEFNHIDLTEEKQWIEASKLESSAFEPLYLKYYDEIYRYVFRRTGRENLSAEICSEAFYKYTWRNIPFGNWLYAIAANEIKKRYRNQKEIFIIELDKIQDQVPVNEAIERVGNEVLVWVLDQLSDTELRLIELKFFENKTFMETGLVLGMKESAVKMRIYRLLLRMRQLINKQHDQV